MRAGACGKSPKKVMPLTAVAVAVLVACVAGARPAAATSCESLTMLRAPRAVNATSP